MGRHSQAWAGFAPTCLISLHLLVAFLAVPEPSSFLWIVRKVLLCVLRDQTGPNPNIPPLSNSESFSSQFRSVPPALPVGQPQGRGATVSVYAALSSLHTPPPSPTLSLGRSWWGRKPGERARVTPLLTWAIVYHFLVLCFPVSASVLQVFSETFPCGIFLGPGEALGDPVLPLPGLCSPPQPVEFRAGTRVLGCVEPWKNGPDICP